MEPTREKYLIILACVGAVLAVDSIYSASETESERCNEPGYLDLVADRINKRVSRGQLENMTALLERCQNRHAG